MTRQLGAERVPFGVGVRAYARAHSELVAAAVEEPVDGKTPAAAARWRTRDSFGSDVQ
jgi:hypothetical protein